MMKNADNVHGTIEKALQQIKGNITVILQHQNAANTCCVCHEHNTVASYGSLLKLQA